MWLMNGTAIQGRGHISEGTPCQDKITSKYNGATYVIALADGAGSAALSHIGAEKCVDIITQYFLDNFEDCYANEDDNSLKKSIYEKLIENLNQLAFENHCSIKELACTLLCVAENNGRFITVHLGDGIIAFYDNDSVKVYSSPDNGEFANITYFVTTFNALSKIRIQKAELPEVTAFYLMSDGAGTSLYSSQRNAASNALKMISDLSLMYSEDDVREEITNFVKTSICARTLDDCSIVYMVKRKRVIDSFYQMSYQEQLDLLMIKRRSSHERRRYRHFCDIIEFFEIERSLSDISKKTGIKPKYLKKYILNLLTIGMLKNTRTNYYANSNITDK